MYTFPSGDPAMAGSAASASSEETRTGWVVPAKSSFWLAAGLVELRLQPVRSNRPIDKSPTTRRVRLLWLLIDIAVSSEADLQPELQLARIESCGRLTERCQWGCSRPEGIVWD